MPLVPTTIKVLLIDRQLSCQRAVVDKINEQKDIAVVGSVDSTHEARRVIRESRPDVIVLGYRLSDENGLVFLEQLMDHYPVPVVLFLREMEQSGKMAVEGLNRGAIEVMSSPKEWGWKLPVEFPRLLADKIRASAHSIRRGLPPELSAVMRPLSFRKAGIAPEHYLVAVGASTGGNQALKSFLGSVPPDFPPIVIVQHMPAGFTKAFAKQLDVSSEVEVVEGVQENVLRPGLAVLARGGRHMKVVRSGTGWKTSPGSTKPFNHHCPSVDVLFDSVAENTGKKAIGVLLTGMGDDGARGLLEMRKSGAMTIGQDQRSCVVYGMPKVAAEIGATQCTCSPEEVPNLIYQKLSKRRRNNPLANQITLTRSR